MKFEAKTFALASASVSLVNKTKQLAEDIKTLENINAKVETNI